MMIHDVSRNNVILVNYLILRMLNRNMMFRVFLHEKKKVVYGKRLITYFQTTKFYSLKMITKTDPVILILEN